MTNEMGFQEWVNTVRAVVLAEGGKWDRPPLFALWTEKLTAMQAAERILTGETL